MDKWVVTMLAMRRVGFTLFVVGLIGASLQLFAATAVQADTPTTYTLTNSTTITASGTQLQTYCGGVVTLKAASGKTSFTGTCSKAGETWRIDNFSDFGGLTYKATFTDVTTGGSTNIDVVKNGVKLPIGLAAGSFILTSPTNVSVTGIPSGACGGTLNLTSPAGLNTFTGSCTVNGVTGTIVLDSFTDPTPSSNAYAAVATITSSDGSPSYTANVSVIKNGVKLPGVGVADKYVVTDPNTISVSGGQIAQLCGGNGTFTWQDSHINSNGVVSNIFSGYTLSCAGASPVLGGLTCGLKNVPATTTVDPIPATIWCYGGSVPSSSIKISNPGKLQLTNGPVTPPGPGSIGGSGGTGDPLLNGKPVCIALPILASTKTDQGACPAGQVQVTNSGPGGAIIVYLKWVLRLFNLAIGGVIVLVLVISGIQYITSAADPARVKGAKKRIEQAVTALVLYMFMFAILNFLVPGGIL